MNASSVALLALPALAALWVVLAITGRARRRTLRARAELHAALAAEKREAERPAAADPVAESPAVDATAKSPAVESRALENPAGGSPGGASGRAAGGAAPELHVRVLAEDTLETLSIRVMQAYEEHGLLLGVTEARQLAEIALAKRDGRPG